MPRKPYSTEPLLVNHVQRRRRTEAYLEVATTNENKLREFRRILTNYEIVGKKLDIEEIQSTNPHKVAQHKAMDAYRANDYNPILIEETSLSLMGLGGRPGPYIKDFAEEVEMRRMMAEVWLQGKDRRAIARVILAIYDGKQVHMREGVVEGLIAESLRGANGFGWDDMFMPAGETRTFAEMSDAEKDGYSMRRMALEQLRDNPFELGHSIFMIDEPFAQEIARVRMDELQDDHAIRFAYALEAIEATNEPRPDFIAPNYHPIPAEANMYYTRYLPAPESASIGLLLTDVDRSNLKLHKDGTPYMWQFGPERRTLALAQRADYFLRVQDPDVIQHLRDLEQGAIDIPPRVNRRSLTIESVLGVLQSHHITSVYSFKDLGYRKVSSEKYVSRTTSARHGLFNKIGKYPRSIYSLGSMPAISGWRDVLVTAAVGHHAVFTHRNSIFAGYIDKQAALINAAKAVLGRICPTEECYERAERNIGAALGCGNVQEELENAEYLYEHAGVRLFRIYTINSDPRVIEIAQALRGQFGDEIELFVGQVSDHKQALKLIAPDVRVDCLFFGHGGGRQCTSATNGMAVTTLEEVYSIIQDERFNQTTIAVEGGVGTQVGHLLMMGVDLISYNQQLAHCVIEQGDVYFEHKNGEICMPYHGSASAPTMIIESANPALARTRLHAGGRTRNVEGKAGYRYFEEKANSMAFYIDTFKHYAARTLADVGVESMAELRALLQTTPDDLLRVVSSQASAVGQAYGNSM